MPDLAALAHLATLHPTDPLHQGLVRTARELLAATSGTAGLSVCVECERAYALTAWPDDGERVSITGGICRGCYAAMDAEKELVP